MTTGFVGHIDLDKFFASLAIKRRLDLKGKPVGVYNPYRGTPLMGVNEIAAKCGFKSAMRIRVARRLCQEKRERGEERCKKCPGLQLAIEDRKMQNEASSYFFDLLFESNPGRRIQSYGPDEAFIDYSGLIFLQAYDQFEKTRETVNKKMGQKYGVSASACLAPNPWLAKMGTNFVKPGFLTLPTTDSVKVFYSLPTKEFHGVGEKISQKLNQKGIQIIGDIAKTPREELISLLGIALGNRLFDLSHGKDESKVTPWRPAKSVGNTTKCEFPYLEHLQGRLRDLVSKVSKRMKEEGNYFGRTVWVGVRFPISENELKWIGKQKSLPRPHYFQEKEKILLIAMDLLFKLYDGKKKINLIGLKVTNLTQEPQLELL